MDFGFPSDAAHAPGDRVEIVAPREGERVTLPAVLGRR